MDVSRILTELDAEISRLQKIREALSGVDGAATPPAPTGRRGRPKGSTAAPKTVSASEGKTKRKRNLSPEGRQAIAEAMKRRWAERRESKAEG